MHISLLGLLLVAALILLVLSPPYWGSPWRQPEYDYSNDSRNIRTGLNPPRQRFAQRRYRHSYGWGPSGALVLVVVVLAVLLFSGVHFNG
jgi:hypothetical protein